jgi:hypothetical protein
MIKQLNLILEDYGISKFLYYKTSGLEDIERAELETVRNNRVPGLLPCVAINQDGEVYLRYDVVSEITLELRLKQPATKAMLSKMLLDIAETLIEAKKQKLNPENFVFDKKHVFIDNFSSRLVFIYLPIKNDFFEKVSLKEFLKEIVAETLLDEGDDFHFFVKLHNYLLRNADIDPQDLYQQLQSWIGLEGQKAALKLEDEEENRVYAADKGATMEGINSNYYSPGSPVNKEFNSPFGSQSGIVTSEYSSQKKEKKKSRQLEIEEELQYKRITRTNLGEKGSLLKGGAPLGATTININPNGTKGILDEFEGTTVLGADMDEDEGTTMLGIGMENIPRPYLISLVQNEKIVISKDVFKIGRDPGQADYISNNKVIGRVHASILEVDGEYFFEDHHSRNGSYINGVKVSPEERVKIKHEDRIKLANEEFIFKLF